MRPFFGGRNMSIFRRSLFFLFISFSFLYGMEEDPAGDGWGFFSELLEDEFSEAADPNEIAAFFVEENPEEELGIGCDVQELVAGVRGRLVTFDMREIVKDIVNLSVRNSLEASIIAEYEREGQAYEAAMLSSQRILREEEEEEKTWEEADDLLWEMLGSSLPAKEAEAALEKKEKEKRRTRAFSDGAKTFVDDFQEELPKFVPFPPRRPARARRRERECSDELRRCAIKLAAARSYYIDPGRVTAELELLKEQMGISCGEEFRKLARYFRQLKSFRDHWGLY
jgi:hypothetical protein